MTHFSLQKYIFIMKQILENKNLHSSNINAPRISLGLSIEYAASKKWDWQIKSIFQVCSITYLIVSLTFFLVTFLIV